MDKEQGKELFSQLVLRVKKEKPELIEAFKQRLVDLLRLCAQQEQTHVFETMFPIIATQGWLDIYEKSVSQFPIAFRYHTEGELYGNKAQTKPVTFIPHSL